MNASTMERRRHVDHPRNRVLVGGTLVLYGLLLVVAEVIGVRAEAGMSTSPIWSTAHLAVVAVLAVGVWRAQHWDQRRDARRGARPGRVPFRVIRQTPNG